MRSLIERQIRKYLTDHNKGIDDLSDFLEAIDRSYDNYDTQLKMIRRAMMISSDELFEANKKLTEQAKGQSKLIDKLKEVINTLSLYQLPKDKGLEDVELNGEKLAKFIDDQAKQIVEANTQKEQLVRNLEKQNQELNEYAHVVSHDLKSPLRSIDALANWLKEDYEDKLDENGNETLNHILNNVEKMDALITGILSYSTIDKKETEVYEVDLDHLVKDIIHTIHVPGQIKVEVKGKLPIVMADKFRMQQLFQNLIQNAINHVDKENGNVVVGAKDKKKYWEFYVKDNGVGIPQAQFEKIFQVFQKLDNDEKATGIGLSIVKKIIQLYGGEIWLDSKLSEGTTFYFILKK